MCAPRVRHISVKYGNERYEDGQALLGRPAHGQKDTVVIRREYCFLPGSRDIIQKDRPHYCGII